MKSEPHQKAFQIVISHPACLMDDEPLDGLIEDIATALQDSFDLGFKAAGGSIDPIENTMEHIARDIQSGIFPKKSEKKDAENG